jgi:O-methyltransferase involved in polyketide biosynthesis
MSTEKIHFTKEKETMLMTLSGRATQAQWPRPILPDPWAVEAMSKIDYDMSNLYKGTLGTLMKSKFVVDWGCAIIATRAATFDMLTRGYLADHTDATVLHLGCGMDSRAFRLDPPASVQWFDVDYPDVIDMRRKLFPDRPNYHLIGAPLDDLSWLAQVPKDHPGLIVAEGVLCYLPPENVKALLNAVTAHFPSGEMIFDAMPSYFVKTTGKNVGGTGATYKWALDDPADIKQLDPKLEPVKEFRMHELVGYDRFALPLRGMYRLMELNPSLRRADRICVFRY